MRAMPAFAAALLTVSLALAGCSAGQDSGSDSRSAAKPAGQEGGAADRAGAGADAADTGAAASAAPGGEGAKTSDPAGVHVIRTAELTVRVENTQRALGTARAAAENSGGLVEDEATERDEDNRVTSRIVLRVPQDSYDAVLTELSGTGTLVARRANAKDVTDQVVDVNSRVASQRVSVARVRKLMDRATGLSDVVALEGELSSRQSTLESLLAQQASLKDRTTLATITLELSETPVTEKPNEDEGPGFADALGGGWDALLATLRWIAVVVGAVVPFAAVFVLLYLLWRLVRRRLPMPLGRPATAPAGPPAVPGGRGGRGEPSGPGGRSERGRAED
jgi:hypothetical protein